MRIEGHIGIGLMIILFFGCGGSDEEAANVANETGAMGNQALVTVQPEARAALNMEGQGAEKQLESKALPEPEPSPGTETPTRTVRKRAQIKPQATNEGNPLPAESQPTAERPRKKTLPSPVAVVPEPAPEQVPPEPRPDEEVVTAEAEPARGLNESETQTVVIPPSPPRRSPPGTSGPVVVSRRAEKIQLRTITLPAGSVIEVRTAERISSKDNVSGDSFEATLAEELVLNGEVIFGRGAEVRGRLLDVLRPGRVKGRGAVTFDLQEIRWDEATYALETNSITLEAESSKGQDAAKVGAATAIGAVLGAVFGGKKGAAVGGATGGGAGAAGILLSRGRDVEIPAERLFSFRLETDVELRLH